MHQVFDVTTFFKFSEIIEIAVQREASAVDNNIHVTRFDTARFKRTRRQLIAAFARRTNVVRLEACIPKSRGWRYELMALVRGFNALPVASE
jgi:hypothetical protein